MRSFLAFVVAGWVAAACGGSSVDTRPTSCSSDADCVSSQRCTAGTDRPAYLPSPCARVVPCEAGSECGPGEVCAPSWQSSDAASASCAPKLCSPSCDDSSCPADAECADDGLCVLTSCDAPGAAACPPLWACDPAAAKVGSHAPAEGAEIHTEGGEQDIERQMARGCVRLPCDASGGYLCAQAWLCDPDATDNASGCVPGDCKQTKQCANSALVCTNLAIHPEAYPPDVNGCITRTCDDGTSCAWITPAGVDVGRCQYGAPDADPFGCIVLPCEVDVDCGYEDYLCDHESRLSDQRGCRVRSCAEGKPCGIGLVCAPDSDFHGADDCAAPDNATGGGGGAQVNAGSAGSASGAGGTTTLQVPRGECVVR